MPAARTRRCSRFHPRPAHSVAEACPACGQQLADDGRTEPCAAPVRRARRADRAQRCAHIGHGVQRAERRAADKGRAVLRPEADCAAFTGLQPREKVRAARGQAVLRAGLPAQRFAGAVGIVPAARGCVVRPRVERAVLVRAGEDFPVPVRDQDEQRVLRCAFPDGLREGIGGRAAERIRRRAGRGR